MNNVKRSRTAKAVLLTGISLVALSVFAVQRGVSLYGVSVNNLDFYYAVPEDYYEDPVPYTGYQVEQYVQYDSYSSGPAAFSSVSIGIDEEDSMSACDETSILYAPDNCHSTYYQNQNQQQMSSIAVPYPDYDSGNPCDPNSLAYDPTACDQLERSLYEFSASSPSLPPATPSPTFCQYNPSHPSCTSSSSSGGCDICDQNCVDYDPSQCGGTPRPAPFPQPSPSPTICQINPSDPSCTSSSSGNCDICDQNCVDYDPSQCSGTPPRPSPQQSRVADAESTSATVINTVSIGYLTLNREMINNIINLMRQMYGGG